MDLMRRIFLSGALLATTASSFAYSAELLAGTYDDKTMSKQDMSMNGMPKDQAGAPKPMHQNFDNNVFIEADFIYWNVQQEGNNYAAGGNPTNTLVPIPAGLIYRPPSKMTPGFKVALGMNVDKDMWDAAIRYTWFHSHSQGKTPIVDVYSNNLSTNIHALFGSIGGQSIIQGTANSTIHFNALDGELGKNCYLSPNFHLRTLVGLKGVWLKEDLVVDYLYDQDSSTQTTGTTTVQALQHYWGLGPRVGVSGLWRLYKNYLGLFGDTAFSALWSGVKVHATDKAYGITNAENTNQEYKMHTLIPAFELSLGLQSEWIFDGGSRLLVSSAWETQMFLFMAQHSSTIADLNLNMQGWTLKFRYDF